MAWEKNVAVVAWQDTTDSGSIGQLIAEKFRGKEDWEVVSAVPFGPVNRGPAGNPPSYGVCIIFQKRTDADPAARKLNFNLDCDLTNVKLKGTLKEMQP
jgi:hypothetical protein